MVQQMLVVGATRYSFAPKDDENKRIEGCTLQVVQPREETDDRKGDDVVSVPAPKTIWSKLKSLPGIYTVSMIMAKGKDNKPTLKAADAEFVEAVTLIA